MMKSILIVEDNELNLKLLYDLLIAKGYSVNIARSGEECLQRLENFHPDLILMDIHLPGISGIDTLKEIRKNPQFDKTVVLAVTASVMSSDKVSILESGFAEFISKPINISSFLEVVSNFLKE
ncbi:MAG: response regulator [Betaproteobacteria bacterium]